MAADTLIFLYIWGGLGNTVCVWLPAHIVVPTPELASWQHVGHSSIHTSHALPTALTPLSHLVRQILTMYALLGELVAAHASQGHHHHWWAYHWLYHLKLCHVFNASIPPTYDTKMYMHMLVWALIILYSSRTQYTNHVSYSPFWHLSYIAGSHGSTSGMCVALTWMWWSAAGVLVDRQSVVVPHFLTCTDLDHSATNHHHTILRAYFSYFAKKVYTYNKYYVV